jgi:hypothetical protein
MIACFVREVYGNCLQRPLLLLMLNGLCCLGLGVQMTELHKHQVAAYAQAQ